MRLCADRGCRVEDGGKTEEDLKESGGHCEQKRERIRREMG
jgi:hypothetical protein